MEKTKDNVDLFIERLEGLDAGAKARLKRNAGNTMSRSRGALPIFFRILPYGIARYREPWYFLVATLYPLADAGGGGNIGQSLRIARRNHPEREKGYDRRFEVLLDADKVQLPFRLRQIVRLLNSADIRLNWPQLLRDLQAWDHPRRYIQERWARSYYTMQPEEEQST